MSATLTDDHHYVVISADCHGGANIDDYRPYLASKHHAAFDEWRAQFENPYDDLAGNDAERNWNSSRRLQEMQADGVVGEVIFPNTIPPFFPKVSLLNQTPGASAGDLELRWAGLQAHNRWLAEFCQDAPGQRAGIAQIMLHDIPAAVEEVKWAKDAGLTGGVLLPGAPPGSDVPPLYAPDYEPLWQICEDLGMPISHHSGSATPDYGPYKAASMMFIIEVTWWAHRALWHLIFSGVMERHPNLQFVFTEQGSEWIPAELTRLDMIHMRMRTATGTTEAGFGADVIGDLHHTPSEYWARQCSSGASFIRRHEVKLADQIGHGNIMWGSDYPHLEGCWPWSTDHMKMSFGGYDPDAVAAMLGGNAARIYGFDLDTLQPLADEFGPTVADLREPLKRDQIPDDALRCPAFAIGKFRPDPDLD